MLTSLLLHMIVYRGRCVRNGADRRGNQEATRRLFKLSRAHGQMSRANRHPFKRIDRGAYFIRNSITSFGVLPRAIAAKFRVHQIRAFPAMTRCRSASVPPDCE